MTGKFQWSEFMEDFDVHGMRQLTRKSNGKRRRILWGLLLLGSLGALIGLTVKQLTLYYSYEHITRFDVNFVHKLDFPAVTVCNVNKLRRSVLTVEDIAALGPYFGFTDNNLTLYHPEFYPQDWFNETFLTEAWQIILNNGTNTDDYDVAGFFNRTGYQFAELIPSCLWKGTTCNASSWTTVYTRYGKCYTFNQNGSHKLLKSGSGNGLKLTLYDEEAEFVSSEDSSDRGIKIMIHSNVTPPFPSELGSGFAPGYHHFIALSEKEFTGLPKPFGDCVDTGTTKYYNDYTVSGCRIECQTEVIYEQCACRLVHSPGDYPVCSVDQLSCASDALRNITGSDRCLCHNPCHSKTYSYILSMLTLRESSVEKLKKVYPISENVTRSSLLVANIYFDSLAYETVEQVPAYTLTSVASDFGGSLGLWLGASALAFAQFADFLVTSCYRRYIKPKISESL